MALIVPADFDAWIGKSIGTDRQEELVDAVLYAQSWVARAAGIRSLEKETSGVAVYLESRDAFGCDLWLPADVRPAWHNGSDLMTVTENGTSVSVSSTYSTTAGAIITNANSSRRVRLYRVGGWYGTMPQSIVVTCKVGFDADPTASVLPVPHYVRRLVMEVAWLLFRSPSSIGQVSQSKAGAAVTFENDLSPQAQAGLELLRGV